MTLPLFGFCRAICVDADDPLLAARIQVQIPSVLGDQVLWAAPCQPPGKPIDVPEVGSGVWVVFEGGDTDYPVWVGVWQSDAPPPSERDLSTL